MLHAVFFLCVLKIIFFSVQEIWGTRALAIQKLVGSVPPPTLSDRVYSQNMMQMQDVYTPTIYSLF